MLNLSQQRNYKWPDVQFLFIYLFIFKHFIYCQLGKCYNMHFVSCELAFRYLTSSQYTTVVTRLLEVFPYLNSGLDSVDAVVSVSFVGLLYFIILGLLNWFCVWTTLKFFSIVCFSSYLSSISTHSKTYIW